ncbi:MAG: hypothetical protein JRH11_14565 [Deltaproteobacteria bacterium]|nr:hypothetical protein [Deltaproteobacteria bacterium]
MRAVPACVALLALMTLTSCTLDAGALVPSTDAGTRARDSSLSDAGFGDGALPDGASPDSGSPDAGRPDGASPDSSVPDAGMPCTAWGAQHFDPCTLPGTDMEVNVSEDAVYDTDSGTLRIGGVDLIVPNDIIDQGGTDARIIVVDNFRIGAGARLRVVGSMPLIVASWGTIAIEGDLDAGSVRGGVAGAGANHGSCNAVAPTATGDSGTGGGGGGGFGGRGGNGGEGDSNNTPGGTFPGGSGGAAVATPTIVRGGCPGAQSGPDGGGAVGAGGTGGGAIQLSALGAITVPGRILAGGAGGTGGPDSRATGGGGAGSGGYIGLEGSTVTVTGVLAANGGGGGEGTDRSNTGDNGEDAHPDESRAPGGSGGTTIGTDGGMGGAGAQLAGADVPGVLNGGGGGGGGGVGFVLVWSADYTGSGAAISPAVMSMP